MSHRALRRIVDALRYERIQRSHDLLIQTKRLREDRRRLRAGPCTADVDGRTCGSVACDIHAPVPLLSGSGIAYELMTESYITLINREAIVRLLSIVPWRPGTFRRAILGIHFDTGSLSFRMEGHDLKTERDRSGQVRWQMVSLRDLEYWDDPEEVDRAVDALTVMLDEARPWCRRRAHRTGERIQNEDGNLRDYLFLNAYGVPWSVPGTFSNAFRTAIEHGTALVNRLEPGDPILLPTGWGARSSYIMRFLWADRARRHGATYEEIAAVLGNSPATVRRYYQDEEALEAQNRVTRTRRHSLTTAVEQDPSAAGALVSELEAVHARIAALPLSDEQKHSAYNREVEALLRAT